MHDHAVIVPSPETEEHGPSNVALFLALFLLILAFFILLVAISTVEKAKSDAVMNSLTSTFTKARPRVYDPTDYTAKDGTILAGHQFQELVTNLFSTTLQVAKIEIVRPGQMMRVAIPVNAMFAKGEAQLRPVIVPLFDRIVAALSGRPPGVHFDMEFVVAVRPTRSGELPTKASLAMSRAGGVVKNLAGRGVPPDSISIGMRAGNPDMISINFYVRNEDEQHFNYLIPNAGSGERN